MAEGQRYPSPPQAQMTAGPAPFYNQQPHDGGHNPPSREADDDVQLRAELSRSLAPTQLSPSPDVDRQSPHRQPALFNHELYAHAQLEQSVMGLQDHQDTPFSQPDGDQAGRAKDKRQKVSRACDECRRKKIRCDALDETASEACTNCKRTAVHCAFSRQPLKRGPSKGYIKELAERLNALEGHMQPPQLSQHQAEMQYLQQQLAREGHVFPQPQVQAQQQQQVPPLPQAPPQSQNQPQPAHHGQRYPSPPSQAGRKRTHSVLESHNDEQQDHVQRPTYETAFPEPQCPLQYAMASPPLPSPMVALDSRRPPSPDIRLQPFFKYGSDARRRDDVSAPYDAESGSVCLLVEWDEEVVDEYYRLIHQTFPMLPHSKHRLRVRLAECPSSLREAFLTVLSSTVRTFPSSTLRATQSYSAAMKRAAEQLAGYPFDNPSQHTPASNLVYLQTLLLMALESDNHGPATMRGQAGPSRAEWLGRAAGVAGQLEINLIRPQSRFATEGDPDSQERLGRRVWWVLFILDRWHASSTADLLKLPENSVVLLPEDQILLGESTYHLARLSFIIGHLAAILTTTKTPETNVMAPSNPASQLLGLTLAGEIDRFRESVESVWGSLNLVHLSYHHSQLLIKRLNPQTEPTELIGHALKVATVLNQRQTPITPLNHHFAALSAMTLCELVDVDRTHADAARGLEHLSEALGLGRGLAGHQDSSGWDSAIRELVGKKRARLRGSLAPAAGRDADGGPASTPAAGGSTPVPQVEGNVAATATAPGGRDKFDPTMLTRYGYLTALGQGMFQAR